MNKAENSQQVVARSAISARLHQPRVWGRSGAPTAFDVDSFYNELEKNPVFALTRRAFGGGSGSSRQVVFGTQKFQFSTGEAQKEAIAGTTIRTAPSGGGGQVMLPAGPASSAARSKVEVAHASAALALRMHADPWSSGVWERATPHVLQALPRHYMLSRQWQQLAATLGNLCFLTRLVAVRGLEDAISTCTAGLDAIADSADEGDVASQAHANLVLHRSFLCGLRRRVRGASHVTGSLICKAALQARLEGVSDLAHTIHRTIQTGHRLLASAAVLGAAGGGDDFSRHVPAEIALERCRRCLLSISKIGLLGVSDAAASRSIIDKISQHLAQLAPMDDAVLLHRLAALDKYARGNAPGGGGGAGLAADSAALLARACLLPSLPLRKHLRIRHPEHVPRATVAARILEFLRKDEAGAGCYLVRSEPLFFPARLPDAVARPEQQLRDAATSPAASLSYVSCPADVAADVADRLQAQVGAESAAVLEVPPFFALLRLSPGPLALAGPAADFRMRLANELAEALDRKLHPHVISISPGRTHVLVELLDEALGSPVAALVEDCVRDLQGQMGNPTSTLRSKRLGRDIEEIHLHKTGSWMPPVTAAAGGAGGWGGCSGGVNPSATVCSGMSDFAAERHVMGSWVLPALQVLMREAGSDFSFVDLRRGGAEQCDKPGRVGIKASLEALSLSRLPLPGEGGASNGDMLLPLVIALVGHEPGASPGDGKGQKDELREGVGADVEAEVRWLRRVVHPRLWPDVSRRVGKILSAEGGLDATGGLGGGLSYLEIELAASWLSCANDVADAQGVEVQEWGAICEGLVMMRGESVFEGEEFAKLPPSSQRALRQGDLAGSGASEIGKLRELLKAHAGSRVRAYESRVQGFQCLTGAILSKVQRLKDTLVMDLSVERGWLDGGAGGLARHRRHGLLRVSVDALTIRQRAMTAAKRAEIMGWWLLLKEEWVRTKGLVGLPVSRSCGCPSHPHSS